MNTLSILNKSGDTKLTWNPDDAAECAAARLTVADLKAAGYSFFLVDNQPFDEVTAGSGTLIVRKLSADEVVAETPATQSEPVADPVSVDPNACKRCGKPRHKGRCRTADLHAFNAGRHVVAVRPVAGG